MFASLFHGVTGGVALTLGERGKRVQGTLYSSRNLVYSLSPSTPISSTSASAPPCIVGVGQRALGRLFVEGGTNDYTAFAATTPRRREDVSSYGASLTITLHRSLSLGIAGPALAVQLQPARRRPLLHLRGDDDLPDRLPLEARRWTAAPGCAIIDGRLTQAS